VVLASYLVGIIPKLTKYLPTMLTDGNSLIYGLKEPTDYTPALIVACVTAAASFAVSLTLFNKKQL
jgi:ABC-2 type transport system permease protein